MITFFLVLIFLQIKHHYIDFINQTDEEITHKGIYLDWRGIKHSLKHGLATFAIFFLLVDVHGAVVLGAVDFLLHYHIDWLKTNFGNRTLGSNEFWKHFGLDQFAHQLTYIGLISLTTI